MSEKKFTSGGTGSVAAPSTFYIKITADGPYLVYGNPPIDQEIIIPNEDGNSWLYQKGEHFQPVNPEHIALCRCGCSKHQPFCDGSHKTASWSPEETASFDPILQGSQWYEGEELVLSDNEKYCAYARFCDACGRVWNIVGKQGEEAKKIFFHETGHCPSGRLIGWDKETGKAFEPKFDPSIGLIEDPQIKVSGPIWVKGGIRIESADGKSYEIRNRVTLCRCGQSSNKPFCDGTHASIHWQDRLPLEERPETW
ncbi:MAG: CDGSH iron-sulfur domain-containing protein [Bacteroidales bacterium]|nr:CDGSH iron-sulfur domain-containing protein [Bacteroidales bacterium]